MVRIFSMMVALVVAFAPTMAQAYVGPGAGITAIGAALGLIAAIGLAFWALIAYPFRRMRKKKKEAMEQADATTTDQSAAE